MASKSVMTLDRALSRSGWGSRTAAREAIATGRVKVNGRVVRDPERWVRSGLDKVCLDDRKLKPSPKIYLAFYKPKGVITSHGDPGARKTVYDFLGGLGRWVAPVGRLDKDTSGLLLMTNDTEFADDVTSPNSGVVKTYWAKINGLLSDETIAHLAQGIEMKRGDWAHPSSVRRLEDRGKYTWLEIALDEGKNREVRRMIEAVGFKVLKLVRTRIGGFALGAMTPGQWRELTSGELALIRRPARKRAGQMSGNAR